MILSPSFGIIVGRFQVHELHDGHMELFRTVRGMHQRVLVFVGVNPGGASVRNPLDFDTRRRMIQAKFPEFTVAPIVDCSTDEAWSRNLDEEIMKYVQHGQVSLYGGRDSFAPRYKGKYHPIELKLETEASGTAIRNSLTNSVIESPDFRAGAIYTLNNMYPRVITCVDAIILYQGAEGIETLLARKEGEEEYRFVGGHADPRSESFESDASREVFEETGLSYPTPKYQGSFLVDGWRWRESPDKIKTLVFSGYTNDYNAKASDDVCEVKWFNVISLLYALDYGTIKIRKEHYKIAEILIRITQ